MPLSLRGATPQTSITIFMLVCLCLTVCKYKTVHNDKIKCIVSRTPDIDRHIEACYLKVEFIGKPTKQ